MEKAINNITKFFLILISIIILSIGVTSIFVTGYFNSTFYHQAELTLFKYSFGVIQIIATLVFLILIILISKLIKKVPNKILLLLLSIGTGLIYSYWIYALKLNPETDQGMIDQMAKAILSNSIDYYLQTANYLFLYPYQLNFTLVIAFIYKIFGQNFMIVEYINAYASIINAVLIYFIYKRILPENKLTEKIVIILLGLFSLYWTFFNVHFYGNILGLTFALISSLLLIYYLDTKKLRYICFSGITIAISIICKSNYDIFLCAILLTLIIDILKNKFKLDYFKPLIIFIISYVVISQSVNLFTKYVLKINLPQGVPMIAFVNMGLSETDDKANGWYNEYTVDLFRNNNYDYEKTNLEAKNQVHERILYLLTNPIYSIKFFTNKLASTWLNPTFQTVWCSLPGVRYRWYEEYAHYISYHETALSIMDGKLYKIVEFYFDIVQIIIFTFAAIGIISKIKDINLKQLIIPITFFGGFIFHFIWETKSIYVIQYYFLLIPFAAHGITYIYELLENKIKKSQE